MFSKSWARSRTIWLNLVYLAAALAPVSLQLAQDNVAQLQPVLPVKYYAVLAFTLPLANAVVRFLTTQPIHLFRPRDMGAGGKT